jgi:hypothetical protein
MDKDKATEFVVSELGKHHSRNEIIVALCEQMGLDWREAELLVQEIESQHGREIAARQSPLILIFGISLFITGLGLTCYNSFFFFDFFQSSHTDLTLDTAFELRALILRTVSLIAGIAMIVGGITGSWKTISKWISE